MNIDDELVALGYSPADANNYAAALTGVGNSSAADNAGQDATRAAQWIQGLIETAQSGAESSTADNEVSTNLNTSLATLLSGIEFANINAWRQLQYLIGSTLEPVSGLAGTPSAGIALVGTIAGAS